MCWLRRLRIIIIRSIIRIRLRRRVLHIICIISMFIRGMSHRRRSSSSHYYVPLVLFYYYDVSQYLYDYYVSSSYSHSCS